LGATHLGLLPGRYAVEAMQLAATGNGLRGTGFDLLALLLIAAGAAIAATAMFRWDKALAPRRGWLLLALACGWRSARWRRYAETSPLALCRIRARWHGQELRRRPCLGAFLASGRRRRY